MKGVVVGLLGLLAALSAAAGPTVYKAAANIPLLTTWHYTTVQHGTGSKPNLVRKRWSLIIDNRTFEEVDSVDVRLRVVESGKTTFLSKPITLRNFYNLSVPHEGSLLPLNRCFHREDVVFEYPSNLWNTASIDYLEVSGARVFTKTQDLHDIGHLFTWMATHNYKQAIPLFTKHPELLKIRNSHHLSAFLMAFTAGEPETIKYMAAHGCKWSDQTSGGINILHMAALKDVANCALALQHIKNVDCKSARGRTPTMKAIEFNNVNTLPWLLAHHADPNILDENKQPLAYYAIMNGIPSMIGMIAKAGGNKRYHDYRGFGWLNYAVLSNEDMLNAVIRLGIPIDDRVGRSDTALMTAARNGYNESAYILLKHGANPHLRDAIGADCFEISKNANTLHSDRFFRAAVQRAGRS